MAKQYKALTPEQADFFLENGYVIIKQAFTKEKAAEYTETMWVRLGLDPNNKSTWDREKIHMPWLRKEKVSSFSPQAWLAMQDLLGGEERIDEASSTWGDSFILNLGTPELETAAQDIHPHDFGNWHVDGDFFIHFLDSPEQALLVIPLFSDIHPRGGGTFVAPQGIDLIANYLAAHPEGVLPTGLSFTPSTSPHLDSDPQNDPGYWTHTEAIKKCDKLVEFTGDIGDVVLMHPLMLHSASKNYLREPRIITNPPVSLREPFNFNRENPAEFSLVEKKTLKALGVDRFDFRPTKERKTFIPKARLVKDARKEEELNRIEMARVNGVLPPKHIVNIAMSTSPIAVA